MKKFLNNILTICNCLFICFFLTAVQAVEAEDFSFSKIIFKGNTKIESDAVLGLITVRPPNASQKQVTQSIKDLYSTGYFNQVEVSLTDDNFLLYTVTENPTLRKLMVDGNDKLSESEIGSIIELENKRFLNDNIIHNIVTRVNSFYEAKGFYNAEIDHTVVSVGNDQVDLILNVSEGTKYKIREVNFTGLKLLSSKKLRKQIITRKYKWYNSWLFGTGRLNNEAIQNDRLILKQYLLDNGFIEANVSEASIEKNDEGLAISFDIEEGTQYTIGTITATGDLINDSIEETILGIESEKGQIFSASKIRQDSFIISENFSNSGYAFANVVPNTQIDKANSQVNLSFEITKGNPVRINKINITGNNKTYDKVIRREFRVQEKEMYSGKAIKRTKTMLQRRGFFDSVDITTAPTTVPDEVDVNVNIKEGNTGSVSVGAGFSTSNGVLFNARLSERNFMGTGKQVDLNADFGTIRNNLVFNYVDPRFRDSFWQLGLNALVSQRIFPDFDRTETGGGFSFGYPLEEAFDGEWAEDWNFSIRYQYLNVEIDNVDPEDAAQFVIDSEGKSTASGITPRLIRNTINNPLDPTDGSRQILSTEVTGLGGNEEFYLLSFRHVNYTPIIETKRGDILFSWRSNFAYGKSFDGDQLPLFKRFFPGGINSVRGFEARTLGPRDENNNEFGGSKQFINNFEIIFPLIPDAKMKGVIFYDIGDAFDDDDSIDFGNMREAYGAGLRWTSPLGPIRIEFGVPVDRQDGEDSLQTLFSFGAPL